MITVVTAFYTSDQVPTWSRCYTPAWVDALYYGVQRHYSHPFQFVCLVDRPYALTAPIQQQPLAHTRWATCLLQCLAVEADRLVFMGLDMVITGNVDALFAYTGALAVPVDPYRPTNACNAVVLCPSRPDIAASQAASDMLAMDEFPHDWLDDLYPGQVVSYKAQVQGRDVQDARIVYFHGLPKPHTLSEPWAKEHFHAVCE